MVVACHVLPLLPSQGVPPQTFQLEAGMFFHAPDLTTARNDFKRLISQAVADGPPSRAKVHLARYSDDQFVVALIYPAEYDDAISRWLLSGDFKTAGAVEGGTSAVQNYYDRAPRIIERHQLFAQPSYESRSGHELFENLSKVIQR